MSAGRATWTAGDLPPGGEKNVLMGVGNPLRRDDGAGNYVARTFRHPGWLVLDCGTVPENFTGIVRKVRPPLLVIVDAAEMGLPAGACRIIPREKIRDVSFGTHQLPLHVVASYLGGLPGETVIVGIQPLAVDFGEGLTGPVRRAADGLVALLAGGRLREIPVLA
ncbi:MAG: hydrogenase maturation peptidase HycI [Methanolinea sp.]|nr:hydrogenase maturation peptidase HycI [Methanolinea sp.]